MASEKSELILSHLDQDTAESIRKLDHVAPVSCCNDAALHYKLNQVQTCRPTIALLQF